MKFHVLALVAASLLALGSAQAATYTYTGDTTGAATYNRPFASFSGLSNLGVNANYQALTFTVTASGSYDFVSTATAGWDNFTFLYSPSFSAASPLVNGVVGNDDLTVIGTSGFTATLTAGTTYVFVTTGFEGGVDFGAYVNTVTGTGSVVAVPEPSSYALMALGLAAVGGLVRRRSQPA